LVLLFQKKFHEGIVDGTVTVTFRLWPRSHVKPGGRYRCHPIGVVEVESIERITAAQISEADARQAGFPDRGALLEYLSDIDPSVGDDTELFRVGFHYGGDGDRVPGALDANLSPDDVRAISEKLERLDRKQAWTRATLAIIRENPRVAASHLARQLGRETAPFKADVVKLKKLGLTQSFEVGYEISPRGLAYLSAAEAPTQP
jgi:hypothetical protein